MPDDGIGGGVSIAGIVKRHGDDLGSCAQRALPQQRLAAGELALVHSEKRSKPASSGEILRSISIFQPR